MSQAQADALAKKLEPINGFDRFFFKRRSDRRYRIRLAFPPEIEMAKRVGVIGQPVPDGLRVYVGVKRKDLPNGTSYRKVIGFFPPGEETDLDERTATKIFAELESHGDHILIQFAAQNSATPSSQNGGVA